MKLVFYVVALIAAVLLLSQSASAHVLINDETNKKGAILHIIPDDDPIAGEEAEIYFDAKEESNYSVRSAELTITGSDGKRISVPTKVQGSLITARYVFPVQGVYDLTFRISSPHEPYTFSQSQRVTRGVPGLALHKKKYVWAEVLFITSMIGLVAVAIIIFNRRHDIAKYSKL